MIALYTLLETFILESVQKANSTQFPTTRWTLILDLQNGSDSQRERALEELCQIYWYPIYGFVRQRGKSPEEAQDLTQSFFARLLAGGGLDRADADKGRLRSYLLGAAKRFVITEWRKDTALKRGSNAVLIPIDHDFVESRFAEDCINGVSPEKSFDRRWAQALLDGVAMTLKGEYEARGRAKHYEVLNDYLFWNSGEPSYAEAGKTLKMSEPAIRQAVLRMRKRFGAILREQVSFTVERPEMVDQEVRELFAAFRSGSDRSGT